MSGSPGAYGIVRRNLITGLSSKTTLTANSGDVLTVTTPGGGGYGASNRRMKDKMEKDRADGKT